MEVKQRERRIGVPPAGYSPELTAQICSPNGWRVIFNESAESRRG